jgi:CHAT domain-containing protein
VAAVHEVRAVLDRDATEESVRAALESASVVHISTHGRHNVYAPAFQALYLWPTAESDGRLAAHEIATFDLSRLELVTFSACETALGRVDPSDNLLGLPATLLLGGVKTIVGTLWPVGPEVSRVFFTEFHAHAARDDDMLTAFAAGQRAARKTDHRYLEWGAFYLVGTW